MILNTSAMKCKFEKVDMLVLNITDRHDIEISLSAQASAVIDSDLYFARQDNPQTSAHALIAEKDNEISLQISFLCHIYVCSQISPILTEFKA